MEREAKIRVLRRRLLAWFRVVGRDLPWRKTHDPYKIVVSEIMLQQTQVDRVIPKYLAFLERFPDFSTLAAAPQSEVIKMWHGLGYNRRALGLQKLAQVVEERKKRKKEGLPSTHQELLALPGIGPYTAEAVRAFAFRAKGAAPVDTNIERVIRRVFGAYDLDKKNLQYLAGSLVPTDSWSWNHALMDFGASICTARSPKCEACPLKDICAAYPCEGGDIQKVKQSTFADSDRMYRGRIISLLRENSVLRRNSVGPGVGLADEDRLDKIIASLVKDRFIKEERGKISLV